MGLVEDRDTDGHVDLIAAFTRPGHVLLQMVDEDNPNFEHCVENRARLAAAGIEVTELPLLPYAEVAGERIAASYLNFYICNRAVIVPVAGADTDQQALDIIAAAYPGREIVPVPGLVLAYGGGGPHCITQQVPRAWLSPRRSCGPPTRRRRRRRGPVPASGRRCASAPVQERWRPDPRCTARRWLPESARRPPRGRGSCACRS